MLAQKVNDRLTKQSKREAAHFAGVWQQRCSDQPSLSKIETIVGPSSFCPAAKSLYRYPSPNRSAYSPSRPITEFRLPVVKNTADIGYHGEIAIHRSADRTNRGAAVITMIGLRLCKRHQSSLRRWQYLVWQVALITMLSAVLRVRQAAWWLQKYLAPIARVQCSQAPRLACCATTQASTPVTKLDNRAQFGRAMNESRRSGDPRAAVFAFLGT